MAYIQGKVKGKKIVSFKFKTCLGRDDNGKQIFKCWTWYPPADLTPAKARKETDRVAGRWEEEQRLAFSQQKEAFFICSGKSPANTPWSSDWYVPCESRSPVILPNRP